jgi:uncharacterized protein (DUF2267 family)
MRSVDELIGRMQELGFGDAAAAQRALDATLAAVGEALTSEEASAVARELPEPCASVVRRAHFQGVIDACDFYERARRHAGAEPGRAKEQTQIALRALGDALDVEGRRRLRRSLPSDVAELLDSPQYGEPPPYSEPGSSSLASGRPGSRHPVAESRADRTQQDSVVRDANPHGDTKLSSSRGLTQERTGTTLAEGDDRARR